MKKAIFWGLIIVLGKCYAQPPTDNPLHTRTDSLVQEAAGSFFNTPGHVGLSLAMYDHGKIAFYNYGSVSREANRLPDKTTLYEIASITKTFTGAILAKAFLDGKMKPDDDIRLYLKESYPNLEYKGHPITIRQLVTHRSGLLNNIPDNSALFKSANFDSLPFQLVRLEKNYDRAKYLEALHKVQLDTIPGSVYFRYSNIGIKLLAFALENVYGASYKRLIRQNILQPLHMNSTELVVIPKDRHRLARGYNNHSVLMPYTLTNAGAAGGLRSCTEDMIRYVAWQLDEKQPLVAESHRILDGTLNDYARGMGWNMAKTKAGERKVWESGGSYGMSSQLILFPDSNTGFILLANDAGPNTQGELEKIALKVFGGLR